MKEAPKKETPQEGGTPQKETSPQEEGTPQEGDPPRSRLRHTVNERPVRILLECILVIPVFFVIK